MYDDPFELRRFHDAQDRGDIYDAALSQLRVGRNRATGSGSCFRSWPGSAQARPRVATRSPRLTRPGPTSPTPCSPPDCGSCCQALIALAPGIAATAVLGGIDALKLRSSMTLFELAGPHQPLFAEVLERFYDGERDPATLRLLVRAELS